MMDKEELVRFINKLVINDDIASFYALPSWRKLRKEVLKEQHYECQECLKKGILTKAKTVHHVNHVRDRPDLALSKTYIDDKGIERKNLIAICEECHNKEHDRFVQKKPLTEEWW